MLIILVMRDNDGECHQTCIYCKKPLVVTRSGFASCPDGHGFLVKAFTVKTKKRRKREPDDL